MKNKIALLIIASFFCANYSSCSENEVECRYDVYTDLELIILNNVNDVGFNDYNCNRNIKIIDNGNGKFFDFKMPKSYNCDFFVKKTKHKTADIMIFYNVDNPLFAVVDLTNMQMLPKSYISSYINSQCNCNTLNCGDNSGCEKLSLCQ